MKKKQQRYIIRLKNFLFHNLTTNLHNSQTNNDDKFKNQN